MKCVYPMPDPTHFSPNSPAGQAPMPDRRQHAHAHSASPKVLSTSTALSTSSAEGLRDPVKPRLVPLAGRTAGRSVLRKEPPLYVRATSRVALTFFLVTNDQGLISISHFSNQS